MSSQSKFLTDLPRRKPAFVVALPWNRGDFGREEAGKYMGARFSAMGFAVEREFNAERVGDFSLASIGLGECRDIFTADSVEV